MWKTTQGNVLADDPRYRRDNNPTSECNRRGRTGLGNNGAVMGAPSCSAVREISSFASDVDTSCKRGECAMGRRGREVSGLCFLTVVAGRPFIQWHLLEAQCGRAGEAAVWPRGTNADITGKLSSGAVRLRTGGVDNSGYPLAHTAAVAGIRTSV